MGVPTFSCFLLYQPADSLNTVLHNFTPTHTMNFLVFMQLDSLKLIHYSYFHSILTYGIIFWGNIPHSNVIFRMQKRIVRILVKIRNRDSSREYFKRLKILPLQSQYFLSLLLFVAENIDYCRLNSEIHGFNNKNKSNLHLPPSKLTGNPITLELRPSITCPLM